MLLEDQVVDAVVDYLKINDWTIVSTAHAHQHGDDIVAAKNGADLRVEAKGEGSSKQTTPRYGLPFTAQQVGSHVGVAVLRALRWTSAGDCLAAVAFPDNAHHRARVKPIIPSLRHVGVGVFWVALDHSVRLDAAWEL